MTKNMIPASSRSLPNALLRAREAVMRPIRPHLRQYDLTEQQWRVLRVLTQTKQIEATELARAAFLLAPSLSRIIRDLHQRGLLIRRNDAQDMRRTVLSITKEGTKLMQSATPGSDMILVEITRRFGNDKMASLQALLAELESTIAAESDGDVSAVGAN